MNERIRELAEQAGFKVNWQHQDVQAIKMARFEKFVQLIVKECIAHGKLIQSETVINGSDEYNTGREMGIEVYMNRIKQHFGVEE